MVIYEKPEVIWEKYYLTALDFFKELDDKEKEHINKLVDFETTHLEIMEAKEKMHAHTDSCGNCSMTKTIEERQQEEWHEFTDDAFFNGEVSDVDAEIMEWLVDKLKGTYDYDWVHGFYAEYDRYTGAKLKNLYQESDGWHVRLMKEGVFD